MAGKGKVKQTITNFSSISTFVSETSLGACGGATAPRHQSTLLLLTAQTLEGDRTAMLAGTLMGHVSWEPRNQTQVTEMGKLKKDLKLNCGSTTQFHPFLWEKSKNWQLNKQISYSSQQ